MWCFPRTPRSSFRRTISCPKVSGEAWEFSKARDGSTTWRMVIGSYLHYLLPIYALTLIYATYCFKIVCIVLPITIYYSLNYVLATHYYHTKLVILQAHIFPFPLHKHDAKVFIWPGSDLTIPYPFHVNFLKFRLVSLLLSRQIQIHSGWCQLRLIPVRLVSFRLTSPNRRFYAQLNL